MLTFTVTAMAAGDRQCFFQGLAAAEVDDVHVARWMTRALTQHLLGRRPVPADVDRLVAGLVEVGDVVVPVFPMFAGAVLREVFFGLQEVTAAAGWDDELIVHIALAAYVMRVAPVPAEVMAGLQTSAERAVGAAVARR